MGLEDVHLGDHPASSWAVDTTYKPWSILRTTPSGLRAGALHQSNTAERANLRLRVLPALQTSDVAVTPINACHAPAAAYRLPSTWPAAPRAEVRVPFGALVRIPTLWVVETCSGGKTAQSAVRTTTALCRCSAEVE